MNRRTFCLTAVLLAAPAFADAPAARYTQRTKTEVREGPGNYYPLVSVLSKGSRVEVLKAGPAWIKIGRGGSGQSASGWIAKNCLAEKAEAKSALALDLESSGGRVGAASVAAAVRGFAKRYGRATESSMSALKAVKEPFFTPNEYQAFKSASPRGSWLSPPARYQELDSSYETSLEEDGIGLGMSARVAAEGLVNDRAKLRYLNMLATLLSEGTSSYDHPFHVYITKGKQANAVAVPGGYLFFTQPLLAACHDEAELAAVLAHEMTHVLLRHGLKEMKARSTELHAARAMDELDEEAGGGPDPEAEELENWASEAYEVVHKPRLQGLEEEADIGAVLLLARAGYEPKAVADMISRVSKAVLRDAGNPFSGMDYQKRVDAARVAASLFTARDARNPERFQQVMAQ